MALDLSMVGQTSKTSLYAYTWKDVVLYALSVGAKQNEFDYVYEGRGPKVIPSFGVIPAFLPVFELLNHFVENLAMIVHGGQKLKIYQPIPPEGTLNTTAIIQGIYDLRKMTSVVIHTETKDAASHAKLFDTSWNILVRGVGGIGANPPKEEPLLISTPSSPAFSCVEQTSQEQALLYRLNGDSNPLHADPEFAKIAGFNDGPILHGLCTFGFMTRAIIQNLCHGDASRISTLEAQFRKPVWPGNTLITEGHQNSSDRYAIVVKTKERMETVIGNASVTLVSR